MVVNEDALVPPFAIGSIPVTSAVSDTVAHVPPLTVNALRNWLVQVVPAMVEKIPEVVIARPVAEPKVALVA